MDIIEQYRQQLKSGGVQVVSAPQLFETPNDLAMRMVDLAAIEPNHRILEPSAGLGAILRAIGPGPDKVAVEINYDLVKGLARAGFSGLHTVHADFLECEDLGIFDRVIMNPPFTNGQDIKHIKHAFDLLKPGGRLVAVCANGPRQREKLKPLVEASGGIWEDLPAGTFRHVGTMVNTALIVWEA